LIIFWSFFGHFLEFKEMILNEISSMYSFISEVENNNMSNFSQLSEISGETKMNLNEFDKMYELKLNLYKLSNNLGHVELEKEKDSDMSEEDTLENLKLNELLNILVEKVKTADGEYKEACEKCIMFENKIKDIDYKLNNLRTSFSKCNASYDSLNSSYKEAMKVCEESEEFFLSMSALENTLLDTIPVDSLRIKKTDGVMDPGDIYKKSDDIIFMKVEKLYLESLKKMTELKNKLELENKPYNELKDKLFRQIKSYDILLSKFEPSDESECKICKERKIDTVFNCGHTCCTECGTNLKSCFMCRGPIISRLRIYL
jgi:hypothetical protein